MNAEEARQKATEFNNLVMESFHGNLQDILQERIKEATDMGKFEAKVQFQFLFDHYPRLMEKHPELKMAPVQYLQQLGFNCCVDHSNSHTLYITW